MVLVEFGNWELGIGNWELGNWGICKVRHKHPTPIVKVSQFSRLHRQLVDRQDDWES